MRFLKVKSWGPDRRGQPGQNHQGWHEAKGQAREVSPVQTHSSCVIICPGEDIPKPGNNQAVPEDNNTRDSNANQLTTPEIDTLCYDEDAENKKPRVVTKSLLKDVKDPLPSYAKDPSGSHGCHQQRPEFDQVGPRPPHPSPCTRTRTCLTTLRCTTWLSSTRPGRLRPMSPGAGREQWLRDATTLVLCTLNIVPPLTDLQIVVEPGNLVPSNKLRLAETFCLILR